MASMSLLVICNTESTICRYVLRNWIGQQAIEKAEQGDYSEVQRVLKLLQNPYSDTIAKEIASENSSDQAACSRWSCACMGCRTLCVLLILAWPHSDLRVAT